MLSNLKPGYDLYKAFKDLLADRYYKTGGKDNLSSGNPLPMFFEEARLAAEGSLRLHETHLYGGAFGNRWVKETKIIPFCESLGISGDASCLAADNIIFGNGATSLYESIVRAVSMETQTARSGSKPVILMPVPNYGLFAMQPDLAGLDVETFPLREENGWQINVQILADKIREINAAENRHAALFYHANPHNPTGIVETPETGAAIARVLKDYGVRAIDDMAYWGQEYKGKATPLAAHNICESITLFSISKTFGLPGLRGGFAVGPRDTINRIADMTVNSFQAVSVPAQHAVGAAFSMENEVARDVYIQRTKEEYLKRYEIVRAMINGLNNIENISDQRRQEISEVVHRAYSHRKIAQGVLNSGIPHFEIVNPDLQAGYFSLLRLKNAQDRYYGEERLSGSFKVAAALVDNARVLTLPGQSMLSESQLQDCFRITFAFQSEARLVQIIKKLHFGADTLGFSPDKSLEQKKQEKGLSFGAAFE